MGLMRDLSCGLASIFGGAIGRQLSDEIGAWSPTWSSKLIQIAIARLPTEERERYREEWNAYIYDMPGKVGPLLTCVGFLLAAYRKRAQADKHIWKLLFRSWGSDIDFCTPLCDLLISRLIGDVSLEDRKLITKASKRAKRFRARLVQRWALLKDCLFPVDEERWIKTLVLTQKDIVIETKL